MANWNNTVLECSNPEVVKVCAAAIGDSGRDDGEGWKDGDTQLHVSTPNSIPHDQVTEISKQFPDEVITCRYSFEHDRWSEIYSIEYRNGEDKVVNIEPNYMYTTIPLDNEKDRDGIYDKAVAFCRRLDKVETDKDGKLFLDFFDEEVCYKFEYDGVDGKKYRVEATKLGSQIDFKVFEGFVKYDWQELPDKRHDDLPF